MPVLSTPSSYLKLVGPLPAGFSHSAVLRGPGGAPLGLFWFFSTPTERREVTAEASAVAWHVVQLTKEPLVASVWEPGVMAPTTTWIAHVQGIRSVE